MHDHLLGVVTGQKYFTFLSATSVVKLFSLPLYSPARAKLSWEIGSLGFSIWSFHTMVEILKFCPKNIRLFFHPKQVKFYSIRQEKIHLWVVNDKTNIRLKVLNQIFYRFFWLKWLLIVGQNLKFPAIVCRQE